MKMPKSRQTHRPGKDPIFLRGVVDAWAATACIVRLLGEHKGNNI